MATQVEHLQPDLLMTMMDETKPMIERQNAMQQVSLWAERVYEAINELQRQQLAGG